MTPVRCDALVLFGISGDLAFRKILPAVYSLFARQQLDLPGHGRRCGTSHHRAAQ